MCTQILSACESSMDFSSKALAVNLDTEDLRKFVSGYVEANKGWKNNEYTIDLDRVEQCIIVYQIIYKDDLARAIPGGGKSFLLHVDAKRKKIIKELYFQ